MNKNDIYDYCKALWEKLKSDDGGYFPSKHDKQVLQQAAEHFYTSIAEAEAAWYKISQEKAEQEVRDMTKDQIFNALKKISMDNSETPWSSRKQ